MICFLFPFVSLGAQSLVPNIIAIIVDREEFGLLYSLNMNTGISGIGFKTEQKEVEYDAAVTAPAIATKIEYDNGIIAYVLAQQLGAIVTRFIDLVDALFGYVCGALLCALIATTIVGFLGDVYKYCFDFNGAIVAGLIATAIAKAVSIMVEFLNGIIGFNCDLIAGLAAVVAILEYEFKGVLTPLQTGIGFEFNATSVAIVYALTRQTFINLLTRKDVCDLNE